MHSCKRKFNHLSLLHFGITLLIRMVYADVGFLVMGLCCLAIALLTNVVRNRSFIRRVKMLETTK
ncbi:MAG: hypothetical protein ACI89U_002375 [Gammaproteobacteria bacterium]|jgi:hypothetical protein